MTSSTPSIAVTFVDDLTNDTISVANLTPDKLPETFEDLETTLNLQGQEWFVVSAVPPRRSEYVNSRKLTIRLRKIEKVDPKTILFSLPSICDGIPGLGDRPATKSDYHLADDDWRQIEFVERQFADLAEQEILCIRRIHEEASAEVGWREIHVRKTPEPPITSEIVLAVVLGQLGVETDVGGVTYYGSRTCIIDGFSFSPPGGPKLYGIAPGGRVQVLGLAYESVGKCDAQSIQRLAECAKQFQLDLVHWCRCCRAGCDDSLFAGLPSGNV